MALALLAGAGPLEAQVAGRAGGEVLGVVVDAETGRPVVGAAVAVWNPATSSIVTGAAAAEDGRFRVQGIPPGTCYVQVTSIGHAAHPMYRYRAPMEFERGKFSSWQMSSVTLKQELWDERASLSLRYFDPFKTMGFRVEVGDEEAFQITEHNFDARALHLTFQINFGQAPKGRPPRTEPEQEPAGVGFPQ